jgi:hypothetical protein
MEKKTLSSENKRPILFYNSLAPTSTGQQIGNDLHLHCPQFVATTWRQWQQHQQQQGVDASVKMMVMMILSDRSSFMKSISVISFVLTVLPNGNCESENRINNYEG